MVDVILNGQIIEVYPNVKRVLVCGPTALARDVQIYLHIVCEGITALSNHLEISSRY
jgi:hypothetical protein